jgi:glucose-1-phosphate thymidylyltransferase
VKALILAAGYATRLRPLTDDVPKMLLPLAGRPMLDYLLDRIREVEEIDELHLVTNARFAGLGS